MCGIAAIINISNAPVADEIIQMMNDRVSHRGPDHGGSYVGNNFALGNRRLTIVDSSCAANQPMQYLEGTITYNGEIYNYREIKKELEGRGYSFKTSSDTEVILASYDCWGPSCVQKFDGMWAFVLFDSRKNIIFASRDRFGQKPLYYARIGNHFVMGSEIKQFTIIPGFRAKLNQKLGFEFLNFAALNHTQETLFDSVQDLPAGHNIIYDLANHQFNINQWYHFPSPGMNGITLPEAAGEFKRLFSRSVETRIKADVQTGSCLSGGLDSSSIVCMINDIYKEKTDPVTLSICWPGKDIDEQEYIDAVVEKLHCRNRKIFPNMNELNEDKVLDRIIYHQDQPVLSASHYAEYKVYEAAAKENIRVMMDGQGADEYLAGYRLFQFYNVHELFNGFRIRELRKEWNAIRALFGFSHNQLLRSLLYIKYRAKDRAIDDVFNSTWIRKFKNTDPNMLPGHRPFNVKQFSNHQLFVSSLPYQLHSADRNSMCHSVEARLPFLDHRLVEFTYSLPSKFKIKNGTTKIVLRNALNNILPSKIANRRSKQAFPAPEAEWMRENSSWVLYQLKDSRELLGNMLDIDKLVERFEQFCQGRHNNFSMFFRVINLNRWAKLFNVSV